MASDSNFWLPPHFLSDHDNLPSKPTSSVVAPFPTDFPYDFNSSPLHSPLESLLGDDDDNDDEDDFLAALTQRLTQSTLRDSHKLASVHKSQAKTAMAGSPQSTLSGVGGWSAWSSVSSDGSPNGPSQAPSPPTTPFGGDNNTWDLIYAAAGQVARLKMNNHRDGMVVPSQNSTNLVSSMKNTGFYSHPSQFGTEPPIYKPENCLTWGRQVKVENQQIHCRGGDFHHDNERYVRPVDFPQSAWPSLKPHHRRYPSQPSTPAVSTAYHGIGSTPKKECAGTGVFLPRRYDNNNPPQPRKRADCSSIALLPAKNIHDLNRSVPQMTSNRRLVPSYEALMAERNTILAQQRLSYPRPAAERGKSHEFLLPQEWTY